MLTAEDPGGFAARLGRPLAEVLARAGAGVLIWPRVRRDLAVLGRSTERHLAEKVTLAIVGLLLVPACAGLLALAGTTLPLALPLWGSLVCGLAGFVLPDLGIHAEAEARRRDFRHALGSFLDLVVIALAGGGGVETALGRRGERRARAGRSTSCATASTRPASPATPLVRFGAPRERARGSRAG